MKKRTIWTIITQYIYFFFLCSVAGYIWEVLLLFLERGEWCNRGFLYGPWLPVYGVGAVLLYFLLKKKKSQPFQVFFLSMLIGGCVELFVGWFLDICFHARYWNYSNQMLNLHGYVCLYSVLGFGAAGVLWICLLSRLSRRLYYKIPRQLRSLILTLLLLAFLTDCAASLLFPNTGAGITF